jgi:hypothetical protein
MGVMDDLIEFMLKYMDFLLKCVYSLNKLLVVIAGVYIVLMPPFTIIGTASSSIMVLAAIVSVYSIWALKPEIEFVSVWFVICGLGVYTGFAWTEGSILRGAVASMALALLTARGLQVGFLVAQINKVGRQSDG